jgi:hypothetical protein
MTRRSAVKIAYPVGSHDGFFLPSVLNFDFLRNQFPDADHFLAVIGEAWLRRNKPRNDAGKAFAVPSVALAVL